MDELTLGIAVFGAVTGAASLGWSVASYILSGGRVKVELLGGWVGPGGLLSGPLTGSLSRHDERMPEPVLVVRLRNLGRLPVVVESWYVKLGELSLGMVNHAANPTLPYTLEPGRSQTWVAPANEVLATAKVAGDTGLKVGELRAVVSLGSGKSRSSARSGVLPSDLPAKFN